MSVDAVLPSKKRMKKTDPSKFKHRLFHKNAVSTWKRELYRSVIYLKRVGNVFLMFY